jgi:predicted CXXCH cytochrome family protein
MKIIKLTFFIITIIFILSLSPFPSYSAEEISCVTCHVKMTQKAKSIHAAVALGCQSCHKSVEGKPHPGPKGGIVLTQSMPGLCYNCHDESKFKGKSVHQPVSGGMCTGCHDPHRSDFPKILIADVPKLCYTCHSESKFKGKSGHTLLGMCTGCHNPHSSNSNKILNGEQPVLCYSCHDKAKFTKKYVHNIINLGGCTSCHAPHISDHPSLLSSGEYELCISCHSTKAKGEHVVALPGRKRHPIRGVKDPSTLKMIKVQDPKNPKRQIEVPDPSVPGKDMNCSSCHDPHSSDFRGLLTQERICSKCHKF